MVNKKYEENKQEAVVKIAIDIEKVLENKRLC
jgi:hypothetical protein